MATQDPENLTPSSSEILNESAKDVGPPESVVQEEISDDDNEPEGWDVDESWEQLLYAIWFKQCTPFLGAGACAGVLPLGATIAQNWATTYNYPFTNSTNLPRVAQFVGIMKGSLLPRLRIKALFEKKVTDHSNPDEPHRVVGELNLPVYITTNYDSFMFKELIRQKKKPTQECCQWHKAKVVSQKRDDVNEDVVTPTPETPVVFHLHGYLQDPNSMVLTEDDYLNFLINISEVNVIPPHIEVAFAPDKAFLFIGYSLEDMSFKVLFRKFAQQIASSPGDRHIAVQLHSTQGLTKLEKTKQREFLQKQFSTQNVKVYWGKASTFAKSLRTRWEAFVRKQESSDQNEKD